MTKGEDKMKKSFAVLGLGRFGTSLATSLFAMGQEVMAVDSDAGIVEEIKDQVTYAVQADIRSEKAMEQLGIQNFEVVIISIGSDAQASIMATVLCKEVGAPYVIAKAADRLHAKLLQKVGADKVLLTEREAGARLARSLVRESLIDYLEISDEYSVSEIEVPAPWIGKNLLDLKVRNVYKVSIIAIRRGETILVTIDPKAPLEQNDVLIVIGRNQDIENIIKLR